LETGSDVSAVAAFAVREFDFAAVWAEYGVSGSQGEVGTATAFSAGRSSMSWEHWYDLLADVLLLSFIVVSVQ